MRDALAALGFGSEELDRIKSEDGVIGVMEAVQAALRALPEDSEVANRAISAIFKGAGEDAGRGFIRNFDLANAGVEQLIDGTNRLVAENDQSLKQIQSFSRAQSELEDKLGPLSKEYSLFLQETKLGFLESFVAVSDFNKEMTKLFGTAEGLNRPIAEALDNFERDNFGKPVIDFLRSFNEEIYVLRDLADIVERFYEIPKPTGSNVDIANPLGIPGRAPAPSGPAGIGVFALDPSSPVPRAPELTQAEIDKAQREADAAAAKAASDAKSAEAEAKRAREALRGIQLIDAQLRETRAEIMAYAGEAAGLAILEANVSALESLRGVMASEGARLIQDAQKFLPDIDAELTGLYASLQEPDADYDSILGQIVEANAERAVILQRLTAAQEGLATPEQLRGLEQSLERFRARDVAPIQGIDGGQGLQPVSQLGLKDKNGARRTDADGNPITESLGAITAGALEQQGEQARAFNEARLEENQALADSYLAVGEIISESFKAAFADGTFSAEAFAKAMGKAIIKSILKTMQARALQTLGDALFATVLDPTAIARAAISVAGITALSGAVEGILSTFAEGGYLEGPSHAQGGVKMVNRKGVAIAEAEGGEGILKRAATNSSKTFEFEGKRRTPRQIGSMLNTAFGGKSWMPDGRPGGSFAEGGILPSQALRQASQQAISAQAEISPSAVTAIREAMYEASRDGSREGSETGSRTGASEGAATGIAKAEDLKQLRQSFQF